MLEQLWNVTKTLVTLADDLQKYNAEIKEIRRELRDLTIIVHALAQDNKHTKEETALKHENLLLKIDKRLQTLEHNLPSAKTMKRITKKSGKKS